LYQTVRMFFPKMAFFKRNDPRSLEPEDFAKIRLLSEDNGARPNLADLYSVDEQVHPDPL